MIDLSVNGLLVSLLTIYLPWLTHPIYISYSLLTNITFPIPYIYICIYILYSAFPIPCISDQLHIDQLTKESHLLFLLSIINSDFIFDQLGRQNLSFLNLKRSIASQELSIFSRCTSIKIAYSIYTINISFSMYIPYCRQHFLFHAYTNINIPFSMYAIVNISYSMHVYLLCLNIVS